MDLSIRAFKHSDIAFALTLTEREGWDSTAELFQICLAGDADGCFIAEVGSRPVGMITTIRHTQAAWIGDLIVAAEARSRGIGRRLMEHAMGRLTDAGFETIRLDADPDGVPLYQSLGFEDEYESLRFRREVGDAPAAPVVDPSSVMCVTPWESRDLYRVQPLDRQAFGEDRSRILSHLREHALTAYEAAGTDRRVAGYAMVWPSRTGLRIGPAVVESDAAMNALVAHVVSHHGHQPLNIGLPEHSLAATSMLASMGFAQKRSCYRMHWGKPADQGRPEWVLAIANGAMG